MAAKGQPGALVVFAVAEVGRVSELQVLLRNPGASELAWVIVLEQELDGAVLADLQTSSAVPIKIANVPRDITKGTALLVSANASSTVRNGSLLPLEPESGGLDRLLSSAGQHYGSSILCLLLSGLAGEGEEGLRVIRETGGIILGLDALPATRRRLPLGVVDRLLPLDQLVNTVFQQVLDQLRSFDTPDYPELQPMDLTRVLSRVLEKTGRDIAQYRPGTIVRCIERRMRIARMRSAAAYLDLLEADPGEPWKLLRDASIGFGRFFGEPEVLNAFANRVLPELIGGKPRGEAIRVWVPGCGTGEDAYSIVIVLLEYMDQYKLNHEVRVIASEADEESINLARRGCYVSRSRPRFPRHAWHASSVCRARSIRPRRGCETA